MKRIKLLPTTKKNKQLIKEFGSSWVVKEIRAEVQALKNKGGLLIHPTNNSDRLRWINIDLIGGEYNEENDT